MPDNYDFGDWEIGNDADLLRDVVRRHLALAYSLITAGEWDLTIYDDTGNNLTPDNCRMAWMWSPSDETFKDETLLTLCAEDLRKAMIASLRDFAADGKDELREWWPRMTLAWRAALDAIDDEAKRLLDLPGN